MGPSQKAWRVSKVIFYDLFSKGMTSTQLMKSFCSRVIFGQAWAER